MKTEFITSAPALVAIARSAHLTGDRATERAARELLRTDHGITIRFRRPDARVIRQEVQHDR